VAKDEQGLAQFNSKNGLVQVVADNCDTQISSQRGQKSTHSLAMIITQAGQPQSKSVGNEIISERIKNLKWEETKASKLSVVDVNVQRFHDRKQSDMPEGTAKRIVPTIAFLARIQLSNQRAAAEDFEFLKSVTGKDLCPEYDGINMTQVRERGKQPEKKTTVLYIQFLDMTLAEPDAMKTAMVHAQHITTLTGREWTVFTCDQQLYKVVA